MSRSHPRLKSYGPAPCHVPLPLHRASRARGAHGETRMTGEKPRRAGTPQHLIPGRTENETQIRASTLADARMPQRRAFTPAARRAPGSRNPRARFAPRRGMSGRSDQTADATDAVRGSNKRMQAIKSRYVGAKLILRTLWKPNAAPTGQSQSPPPPVRPPLFSPAHSPAQSARRNTGGLARWSECQQRCMRICTVHGRSRCEALEITRERPWLPGHPAFVASSPRLLPITRPLSTLPRPRHPDPRDPEPTRTNRPAP